MKSFIGAVIFICVALSANAQLLWKVSGNGLSSPSYIMGTPSRSVECQRRHRRTTESDG